MRVNETDGLVAENKAKRSRLLVKKGRETVAIKVEEIALFYSEHKIAFAITRNGQRHICDQNLSELEEVLDATAFFRVNRQSLVHIDAIVSFRAYERVKLELKLTLESFPPLIISQQTAPLFKKWMYEA